ncbi:hypothetical protein VTK73DRAFT_7290 [Phialemonium thermophilum]|uniref:Major facilitator superfamily (MFS) profile domain-containing protein n=1 Tax=Phialemonium thermophilum TaxID=223376 RepID=A0ABR3WFW3_9PEZI
MASLIEFKPKRSAFDDDAVSDAGSDKGAADVTTALISTGRALGRPEVRRKYWWSRGPDLDAEEVATQPSVYDDRELAEQYYPNQEWENLHRFDPDARWTWGEERKLVRKIDFRIMVWTCVMFCALEMDRANIRQAVTDNLLDELGMTTNDYNLGNSLFAFSFLCAEVPSQLVSKWVGPDRWIPAQMVLWSIVAASQYRMTGRPAYMCFRAALGLLQGGFIPDVVLYLSYFYKHHELSIRLGFFWTAMVIADVVAAFSAYGLMHLRGVLGMSGWRWLFLVEGLVTLCLGVISFGLMPAGPTQTASWFRGRQGWFTTREEIIMVNRVIRDDPSKGTMHNREPITLKLLWRSLMDYDLWPLYIIGLTNHVPFATPNIYLTLSLKDLGFTTFQTNLLVIPSQLLHVTNMLIITYLGEITGQLAAIAAIPQVWSIPFLVWLRTTDTDSVSRWTVWAVMTIFLGNPYDRDAD